MAGITSTQNEENFAVLGSVGSVLRVPIFEELAKAARIPALYRLLYREYHREASGQAGAEMGLFLAWGILGAQAFGQLSGWDTESPIDSSGSDDLSREALSGRICFRFTEVFAVLKILLNIPSKALRQSVAAAISKAREPVLSEGLCGAFLDALESESLPGFYAIDNALDNSLGENIPSGECGRCRIYFVYWKDTNGEYGFSLVRLARLQRSLWAWIQGRMSSGSYCGQGEEPSAEEREGEQPVSHVLERPKLLMQAASSTDGLPQSQELLQSCLTKLSEKRLLLIVGGPGSGKTTLLASLLRILSQAEQIADGRALEIALCAPTARAVQRMRQSLEEAKVSQVASLQAMTLHKLLGMGESSWESYRPAIRESQIYNNPKAVNLLKLDLLVLDEMSMLNSEMAYRLLSRLHAQTRLIFIGDPDQLPPVGAGAFWKDLLATLALGRPKPELPQENSLESCRVELQGSHRSVGAIQQLAENVLKGWPLSQSLAQTCGADCDRAPIYWQERPLLQEWGEYLWQHWCLDGSPNASNHGHGRFSAAQEQLMESIERYFVWLQEYTILSPLQHGNSGARAINQMLLEYARSQAPGPQGQPPNPQAPERFFHGCPVQITRNNYELGLYNGDKGFCFRLNLQPEPAEHNGSFYAVFAQTYESLAPAPGAPEPSAAPRQTLAQKLQHKYRLFPIAQLQHCEPAFVQTIHKSQGSEYQNVCVLLPEQKGVWSRPLLYTAITRAKEHLCFLGSPQALEQINVAAPVPSFSLFSHLANRPK